MTTHATTNKAACDTCDDALTYECHWCGRRSLKARWGPGWIRCPECHMVAPSPAELVAQAVVLPMLRYPFDELYPVEEIVIPIDDPCPHCGAHAGDPHADGNRYSPNMCSGEGYPS